MHKDKLCGDGWTLVNSSIYIPRISWTIAQGTQGKLCKPVFTWYCKKGTRQKECNEDSLNVAYVKTNISNVISVDENLYKDPYATSILGIPDDDIEVTLRYYNQIYDGKYDWYDLCQLPTSPKTKQLPVDRYELDILDTGTAGYKIHSFNYEPAISTIWGESYILTPIRWNEWVFQPYKCSYVNYGEVLPTFYCVYSSIYPQLQ